MQVRTLATTLIVPLALLPVPHANGASSSSSSSSSSSYLDLRSKSGALVRLVLRDDRTALAILEDGTPPRSLYADGEHRAATCVAHDPATGFALYELREGAGSVPPLELGASGNETDTLEFDDATGEHHEAEVTSPITFRRADRAWLGLRLGSPDERIVAEVIADSPAERAGIRAGDRLLTIDGQEVGSRSDASFLLLGRHAGQSLLVAWQRDGTVAQARIVLGLPEGDPSDRACVPVFEHELDPANFVAGTPLTNGGATLGLLWRRAEGGRGVALAARAIDPLIAWLRTERPLGTGNPDLGHVTLHDSRAFPGYTLYSPLDSRVLYLIDLEGRPVHRWTFPGPAWSYYLEDDGSVISAVVDRVPTTFQGGGGVCGRIVHLTWDSEILWDHRIADERHLLHHDIEPLPNGNVLGLVWEARTREDAIAAGRDPNFVSEAGMWAITVREIRPVGPHDGEVVWEWRVWDHLVQDLREDAPNHGDPAQHPERVDVNGSERRFSAEEQKRLEALGYVVPAPPGAPAGFGTGDWTHMNAVDFDPRFDQIVLSARHWSEVWIVDHSTTTEEAHGSTGGRSGHGGDLLYRWGNPERYRRGTESDRQLFGQHDARFIEAGLPGEGHLMVFNNGEGPRNHSSVDEIELPVDADGHYFLDEDAPYEPLEPVWSYADPEGGFSSGFISGAHRLPNGNTLICSGAQFRIFEVTAGGEVVWNYQIDAPSAGGFGFPGPGFPGPGFGGPGAPFGAAPATGEVDVPGPPGIFRAYRIALDHPALAGRTLTPIEED